MRTMFLWIALVAVLCGCGSEERTTYSGPDGSVVTTKSGDVKVKTDQGELTASSDGQSATFTDDKGNTATYGTGPTEDDLGLPFYPGSQEKPNSGMVATQNGKKAVLSVRTTTDSPEQVVAFYKDKLEDPSQSTSSIGEMKTASLTGKLKGAEVAIHATKQGSAETEVSIGTQTAGK